MSKSSLRSTTIVFLFGTGVAEAGEDKENEDEDDDEEEEVEVPAALSLRASGVYRLMARFFLLTSAKACPHLVRLFSDASESRRTGGRNCRDGGGGAGMARHV